MEKDFVSLKIDGSLDFSLIGIISSLSTILAEHQISVFVVSTYNTDYILLKQSNLEKASNVLASNGHVVESIRN